MISMAKQAVLLAVGPLLVATSFEAKPDTKGAKP